MKDNKTSIPPAIIPMGDDDSVFDWGRASLASVVAGNSERTLTIVGTNRAPTNRPRGDTTGGPVDPARLTATGDTNVTRYTPNTINRITDITDLVADSSEDSDDDAIVGELGKRENDRQRNRSDDVTPGDTGFSRGCRHAMVFIALVAIIVGAGVGILYVVRNINPQNGEGGATEGSRVTLQQQLLETAERVTTACSENRLNEDISACQILCHPNMCCFERGIYSCEEDENINCAVYAGCEALR